MLNERRARLVYDDATNEAVLIVDAAGAGQRTALADASLLLDTKGRLVGVDLGGEGLSRMVVMVGAHEDVATTRETRVQILRDAGGEPRELRIADGRGLS
jgi:hypothetical protein